MISRYGQCSSDIKVAVSKICSLSSGKAKNKVDELVVAVSEMPSWAKGKIKSKVVNYHYVLRWLPYSGKVWRGESLANWLFSNIWRMNVWRINRSANRLSIVSTKLEGFSLANHGWFAKFAKLSPRQTFPLYGNVFYFYNGCKQTKRHALSNKMVSTANQWL